MCNKDKETVFYTFTHKEKDNPLFVDMAGDEYTNADYAISRTDAPMNVLCFVVEGEGVIHLKTGTQIVGAGDVFLLRHHENHQYEVNPDNPWHVQWFHVIGDLFPLLSTYYRLTQSKVFGAVPETITGLFEEGLRICKQGRSGMVQQAALNAVLFHILTALWQHEKVEMHSVEGLAVQQYVDKLFAGNVVQKLDYQKMATELHRSSKQLCRIFSKETGQSPYAYYQQQLLLQAKRYLSYTSLNIQQISQRLGFCDPYYFSNFFKKYTGSSPTAFKQQEQKTVNE